MARTALRLILHTALACIAYEAMGDGPAQALTVISSPFGAGEAVTAYVGGCDTAPCQWIEWKRKSDGACSGKLLGNGVGLSDDTEIHGGSGNDTLIIGATPAGGFCGINLIPLAYGGHYCDLYGGAGNDSFHAYVGGDTWLFGEDGLDGLDNYGPGNSFGGPGNDGVTSSGAFASEGLYGEAGADTLRDFNAMAFIADCGDGFDILLEGFHGNMGGFYPTNANCESFH